MATHTIHLGSKWFPLVKSGEKIYEGRCYWKKAKEYQVGDILHIIHQDDPTQTFKTEIIGLHIRENFQVALKEFGLSKVLPGVSSIEEGVQVYYNYVSQKTQQENGVVLLEFQLE